MCFTDLGTLNFPIVFVFKLKPVFATAISFSKYQNMEVASKVVKIDSKIVILLL
jgi:hypothetical protein